MGLVYALGDGQSPDRRRLPSDVILGGDLGGDVPHRQVPEGHTGPCCEQGVLPWATGMTPSVASSAESSLSAIPAAFRLLSIAGVTKPA